MDKLPLDSKPTAVWQNIIRLPLCQTLIYIICANTANFYVHTILFCSLWKLIQWETWLWILIAPVNFIIVDCTLIIIGYFVNGLFYLGPWREQKHDGCRWILAWKGIRLFPLLPLQAMQTKCQRLAGKALCITSTEPGKNIYTFSGHHFSFGMLFSASSTVF